MITPETVEGIILAALNDLNEELGADEQIDVGPDTVLFGADAQIDSLALVSLIVDTESALTADHGLDIALTDDRAMTRETSPFSDVPTLKAYILELAAELEATG